MRETEDVAADKENMDDEWKEQKGVEIADWEKKWFDTKTEWQKDRKTEKQKDRKAERQKILMFWLEKNDWMRKTERHFLRNILITCKRLGKLWKYNTAYWTIE
jgi:hypothetical protein